MKPHVIAASLAALTALAAAPAVAKDGPQVRVRHAVARMVVIVEDRADVAVEIEQGSSGLPAPRVTRTGNEIRIDGGLGRRVAGVNVGDAIRNCEAGSGGGGQPGEGASVEVRGIGRVNLSAAPLIVVRTPRVVDVSVEGAVFGAVGRGASSIDLGNGGCGVWTVANTDGHMSLSQGGSGAIRAGTSGTLDIAVGGSGSVTAGATRDMEVAVGGSGDVAVARVDGPGEVAIGGSGDVLIRDGAMTRFEVSIGGSGNVDYRGATGDLEVAIAGSGDVRVGSATGNVSRSIVGSGNVTIGR